MRCALGCQHKWLGREKPPGTLKGVYRTLITNFLLLGTDARVKSPVSWKQLRPNRKQQMA